MSLFNMNLSEMCQRACDKTLVHLIWESEMPNVETKLGENAQFVSNNNFFEKNKKIVKQISNFFPKHVSN